jgi:CheY-like chemotaxis protein
VLVDDDPLIIIVHKMILSRFKKDALVVDFVNPVNALAHINANNPDIVFLDINMPEMNAWEFLNRLERDLSFTASVVIISSSIDPAKD